MADQEIPNEPPPPTPDEARPNVRAIRTEKVPPNDADLERSLVGAMLLAPAAATEALDLVAPEDFYQPRHQHLVAAIAAVVGRGEVPDVPTTVAELRRMGLLDEAGGPGEVLHAQATAGSPSRVGQYAAVLNDYARARKVLTTAFRLREAGYAADLEGADHALAEAVEAWSADRSEVLSTWATIDLRVVLEGGELHAPPLYLQRSDGQALLYPGRVHAFNAESETGKSWLALAACTERIQAGEHVLYLDFEDGAPGIVERLLALGLEPDAIVERFHYVRPDDPISVAARASIDALLKAHSPTVAVIDGVTEAMVGNGWSLLDNDDVATFYAALPRPLARGGAAVVMVDHVPKDAEKRGMGAIGAQHKRAGIDGASYSLEVLKPFGRGLDGVAKITVTKDRPGHVRAACMGGKAAGELRLHSREGGDVVEVELTAPTTGSGDSPRWTSLMEQVSRAIQAANGVGEYPTVNEIRSRVKSRSDKVTEALAQLVDEGWVTYEEGPRDSHLHTSMKPYRQADDPLSDRYESPESSHQEEF